MSQLKRANRFMLRGGWAVLFFALCSYCVAGGPQSLGASQHIMGPLNSTLLAVAALILPSPIRSRLFPASKESNERDSEN